ncbi:MAG: hypothetical protein QXP98_03100 [Thermoproteus sp.]
MIVFVDESGAKSVCNCVALGAVYFPPRRGPAGWRWGPTCWRS